MRRARRADAKTALEQVRAAQEMWRAERGSYAIDAGGNTAETILLNTMGAPAAAIGSFYTWSFTTKTAATFTATAAPVAGGVQEPDGSLTIDQNGAKEPADKWAK